jgi:hypothetical protein
VKTVPHCEHLAFLPACFSSALNRFPQAEHSATIAIGENSRPEHDISGGPPSAQPTAGYCAPHRRLGQDKTGFCPPRPRPCTTPASGVRVRIAINGKIDASMKYLTLPMGLGGTGAK